MKEDLKQCVSKYHKLGQGIKDSHAARDDWDGFYRILTDLYPDNAHFVFELLQNAEDAVANKVKFELNNEALIFKHDGSRDFNADDINSITSIGKSNKDENQIGEFGIGFKSVFTYTTSPKIHSKDISFKIEDLIVPSLIDSKEVEEGYIPKINTFPTK